jgi:acyl-CoA hydrolase
MRRCSVASGGATVGTGCGEPQHLVRSLARYVESNPTAFFGTEIIHVLTLGVAPYADERFQSNFRHNSFFVGPNTRGPVNQGHGGSSWFAGS